MLHLRNQQLYARENRISKLSPWSRGTVAQSPTERFSFSIFSARSSVPSVSPHPIPFFAMRFHPVPRLISDHRSSFVRSVMGVPLLSGQIMLARRQGRKVHLSSRFGLSPSRLFHSSFFSWSKFSDLVLFRCPCNHLCLFFSRTCSMLFQRSFMSFQSDKLIHDWSHFLF